MSHGVWGRHNSRDIIDQIHMLAYMRLKQLHRPFGKIKSKSLIVYFVAWTECVESKILMKSSESERKRNCDMFVKPFYWFEFTSSTRSSTYFCTYKKKLSTTYFTLIIDNDLKRLLKYFFCSQHKQLLSRRYSVMIQTAFRDQLKIPLKRAWTFLSFLEDHNRRRTHGISSKQFCTSYK